MAQSAHAAADPPSARWHARLDLAFAHRDGRTALASRAHTGPLLVQKPFYPEGDAVCQVVIVHPPGGIAGGDDLCLSLDVAARAHAQLTLPAASKWYRSAGATAVQRVDATLAAGSVLEYLPQGAIVFDGARASSTLRFALASDARLIAWELVCLGRHAASERFTQGRWRQCFEIVRDHALIWSERVDVAGASRLLESPAGLNGNAVFGTFVAVSPALDDAALAAARAIAAPAGEHAVTRLPELLVARWRGPASQAGFGYFTALWSALRPRLVGRAAVAPRIWNT